MKKKTGPKSKDLSGNRVGTLVILQSVGFKSGARKGMPVEHWLCQCDCGKKVEVRFDNLNSNSRTNKSCGCKRVGENHPSYKGYGELTGQRWASMKKGARERNIKVTITIEEAWELYLKQDKKCALSGWFIAMRDKESYCGAASLDRIDSDKDYELGNVQWVHKWINQAKNSLDEEVFINMCKAVAGYNKNGT